MEFIAKYWEFILALIGAFSILSTITANKTDNKIVGWILKIVNFLGANFGLASNKED
jgi:hypothetical protein